MRHFAGTDIIKSMATNVEWNDSEVVFERNKQEVKSLITNLWLATTKWTWLLWLFVMPVAYHWGPQAYEPEDFSHWFKSLFFLGLLFPSGFSLLIGLNIFPKLFCKSGDRYELNDKGIFRYSIVRALRVGWRRIESYRFTDHQKVMGIRVVEFKIRGFKSWHGFSFDPHQIAEEKIRTFFDEHVKAV